jgi:hypothetical protein
VGARSSGQGFLSYFTGHQENTSNNDVLSRSREREERQERQEKQEKSLRDSDETSYDDIDKNRDENYGGQRFGEEESPVNTTDICSAWVLIPLHNVIGSNTSPQDSVWSGEMRGGSPFAAIEVDAQRRGGATGTMRNLFGLNVRPTIKVQLKPLVDKAGTALNPSQHAFNNAKESSFTHNKDKKQDGFLTPEKSLFSLLPANIVLPMRSVMMVGVFRNLQRIASNVTTSSSAKKTLIEANTSIIMKAFPKLIRDEAAVSVLMTLWSLEAPSLVAGTSWVKMGLQSIDSSHLEDAELLQTFRLVVTRVWRAFNSPDAQKNVFSPFESAHAVDKRVQAMMRTIGVRIENGVVHMTEGRIGLPSTDRNVSANNDRKKEEIRVKDLQKRKEAESGLLNRLVLNDQLHTPFNTRELTNN